jgi:hypothetical protein
MGSERALFRLSAGLVENEQERESERGYGGYLYSLSQKLAVGRAVPGNSGYMSGYSGHRGPETPDQTGFCRRVTVTRTLRVYVRILRTFCPDIPDWDPDTPG